VVLPSRRVLRRAVLLNVCTHCAHSPHTGVTCVRPRVQVRRALNDDGARRTVKLVRFPGKGPCDKTVGRLSKRAWHGGKPCPGTATDWVTRGHLCQQSSVWYVTELTLAWWLNVQSNQHEPL
jgi:hypothetical protein